MINGQIKKYLNSGDFKDLHASTKRRTQKDSNKYLNFNINLKINLIKTKRRLDK